jgi:hypothetical protein
MTWTIIVLAVLALVLWSFYVSWRASRLDRLHNRVEAARTALDLALVRRASAASQLASSGLLDPATSLLLADAARRVRQVGPAERDLAESDLTRALRATLGDPDFRKELMSGADQGEAELVAEVEAAAQQVFIARKFYNDLAGRTVYARRRPLARVLRLAGSAPLPGFFDMDDEIADEAPNRATLEPIGSMARGRGRHIMKAIILSSSEVSSCPPPTQRRALVPTAPWSGIPWSGIPWLEIPCPRRAPHASSAAWPRCSRAA